MDKERIRRKIYNAGGDVTGGSDRPEIGVRFLVVERDKNFQKSES